MGGNIRAGWFKTLTKSANGMVSLLAMLAVVFIGRLWIFGQNASPIEKCGTLDNNKSVGLSGGSDAVVWLNVEWSTDHRRFVVLQVEGRGSVEE